MSREVEMKTDMCKKRTENEERINRWKMGRKRKNGKKKRKKKRGL